MIVLIELCNALFADRLAQIDDRHKSGQLDERQFIEAAEKVEWLAVNHAKLVGDRIDPEIMAAEDPKIFLDFAHYLKIQTDAGHAIRKLSAPAF